MNRYLLCSFLSVAVSSVTVGTALAADVSGVVKFQGDVPQMKPLKMDADPICASKHKEPVLAELLVLGDGNTLGNVFVRVKSGVTKKDFPVPSTPVVVEQQGCMYRPRVVGVMKGQALKFLNSDGTLHNVNIKAKVNRPLNLAMPPEKKEAEKSFDQVEEEIFPIGCDVHPWMQGYAAVMSNPYFATTTKDGKFTISGLDAGTYELEAWHEKLGTQTATVAIPGGESKPIEFNFTRAAKKEG